MTRWYPSLWMAKFLPQPLAAAPERVLINFACAVVGLARLVSTSQSNLWPAEVGNAWATLMFLGGLAALIGYWRGSGRQLPASSLERVGYLTIGLAALAYAVALIIEYGWSGAFVGAIFIGIAAAKAIRLVVSSAARASVLRGGCNGGDGGVR